MTAIRIPRSWLLLFLLLSPLPVLAEEPAEVVGRLQEALLQSMKEGEKLGFEGRYHLLEPVVGEVFDFPRIARVVLGRYWRKLEPQQRQAFLQAFRELSVATYAHRFDSWNGEHFEPSDEKMLKKGRRLIKTYLVKADGERVQLDYLVHQTGGSWKILNVIADGVSDLSLKRADYTSTIKNKGFPQLLDKLHEKIERYRREGR